MDEAKGRALVAKGRTWQKDRLSLGKASRAAENAQGVLGSGTLVVCGKAFHVERIEGGRVKVETEVKVEFLRKADGKFVKGDRAKVMDVKIDKVEKVVSSWVLYGDRGRNVFVRVLDGVVEGVWSMRDGKMVKVALLDWYVMGEYGRGFQMDGQAKR